MWLSIRGARVLLAELEALRAKQPMHAYPCMPTHARACVAYLRMATVGSSFLKPNMINAHKLLNHAQSSTKFDARAVFPSPVFVGRLLGSVRNHLENILGV